MHLVLLDWMLDPVFENVFVEIIWGLALSYVLPGSNYFFTETFYYVSMFDIASGSSVRIFLVMNFRIHLTSSKPPLLKKHHSIVIILEVNMLNLYINSKWHLRASLVAQWLRIPLPMQGTRVPSLVRENPTCRGATKPMRHNYWACTLEAASHNYWSPRA